jgi:transposase
MTIVGCDFHPAWQQVAVFDSATGEIRELKLENGNGEAERFYRQLSAPALIGFEAWQHAVVRGSAGSIGT